MSRKRKVQKSTKASQVAFKPLGADEEYAVKKLQKDVPANELEKTVKQECKRIQRIRDRQSYYLFRQLFDFLKTKPGIQEILWAFYDVLDNKHGFGSRVNADYAAESLNWVLIDKGEVSL